MPIIINNNNYIRLRIMFKFIFDIPKVYYYYRDINNLKNYL